jgi:hypothetical protein
MSWPYFLSVEITYRGTIAAGADCSAAIRARRQKREAQRGQQAQQDQDRP